jgi:hypothetical protein
MLTAALCGAVAGGGCILDGGSESDDQGLTAGRTGGSMTAGGGQGGGSGEAGFGGAGTGGTAQAGTGGIVSSAGQGGKGAGGSRGVPSCAYYSEAVSVCDGDSFVHRTAGMSFCRENDMYCHTNAPKNTSDDRGICLFQTIWQVVPFTGTCADFDAYNRGQLDCIADSQCAPGGRCIGFACICGAEPCPDPMPPPGDPGAGTGGSGGASGGGSGGASGTGGGPGSGAGSGGGPAGGGPGGAVPPGGPPPPPAGPPLAARSSALKWMTGGAGARDSRSAWFSPTA